MGHTAWEKRRLTRHECLDKNVQLSITMTAILLKLMTPDVVLLTRTMSSEFIPLQNRHNAEVTLTTAAQPRSTSGFQVARRIQYN